MRLINSYPINKLLNIYSLKTMRSFKKHVQTSIPTPNNVVMLPQFDGQSNSLGPMVGARPHPLGVVAKNKRNNGYGESRRVGPNFF